MTYCGLGLDGSAPWQQRHMTWCASSLRSGRPGHCRLPPPGGSWCKQTYLASWRTVFRALYDSLLWVGLQQPGGGVHGRVTMGRATRFPCWRLQHAPWFSPRRSATWPHSSRQRHSALAHIVAAPAPADIPHVQQAVQAQQALFSLGLRHGTVDEICKQQRCSMALCLWWP